MDFDFKILESVFFPDNSRRSISLAKAITKLRFSEAQLREMHRLLTRNNFGTITPKQREKLESYVRIGTLLDIAKLHVEQWLRQHA
jgi:hypothetical protein